jgi:opacity protein-like surface antigen
VFIEGSPLAPFVLAGYGIGNGIVAFHKVVVRSSDEMDIPILTLGAGLKIFLSPAVAFRAEYRFERLTAEDSFAPGGPTLKEALLSHNVFLGFSVFLPGK